MGFLESKVQVDLEVLKVDVDLQALLVCQAQKVKRVESILMVLQDQLVPLDLLDHLETEEHLVCLDLPAPLEQGVHKVLKANEEILEKLEKKVLLDHQDYLVLLVKLDPLDLLVSEEKEVKVGLLVLLDHLVCLANLDLQVCKVHPVKKERIALKEPKDIEV